MLHGQRGIVATGWAWGLQPQLNVTHRSSYFPNDFTAVTYLYLTVDPSIRRARRAFIYRDP